MSWVLNRQKHRLAPRNLPGSFSPSELTAHSNLHASKAPGRCRRTGRVQSHGRLSPMALAVVGAALAASTFQEAPHVHFFRVQQAFRDGPRRCRLRRQHRLRRIASGGASRCRQGLRPCPSRWPLTRRDRRHQGCQRQGDAGMSNGKWVDHRRTPTPSSRPAQVQGQPADRQVGAGRRQHQQQAAATKRATWLAPAMRPLIWNNATRPVFAQALKAVAWAADEVKPDTSTPGAQRMCPRRCWTTASPSACCTAP